MPDTAINVEQLGKRYTQTSTKGNEYRRFSEFLANSLRYPWQRLRKKIRRREHVIPADRTFWALRDISFSVQRGEVLGVIGRNGAGKSTLLKILSQITEPTTGRIEINGRVASLLEVGTGFHPELTGRENIFLNGAILGMSRAEIRKNFDEIVAFSEVEKFLDMPVKRYSSGMYVRLAFSVAAHLEPEILFVDEVLAVGDLQFQRKCLGKMQEAATKGGRTVLFVSHNMAAVNRLCTKSILLSNGTLAAAGPTAAVMATYLQVGGGEKAEYAPRTDAGGNDVIRLISASVRDVEGHTGPTFGNASPLGVEIIYEILQPVRGLRVGFHLHSPDGAIIFNTTDVDDGRTERVGAIGIYSSRCSLPAGFLNRGQYFVTLGSDAPSIVNFYLENAITFFVVQDDSRKVGYERPGLICPHLEWEIQRLAQR